jgi:hypothetical protein
LLSERIPLGLLGLQPISKKQTCKRHRKQKALLLILEDSFITEKKQCYNTTGYAGISEIENGAEKYKMLPMQQRYPSWPVPFN